ncbi:MAG TPA: ATP synthase F1 subunit gamma [Phycisphaerae bacterium]|nr:ATP synthase F1 subunit gamma [Phycisphaerae bacterium]
MAKPRTILKRVRTIGNIRTVTKAMQAVASARFKAAHDRIVSFAPFATELVGVVGDVIARSDPEAPAHPLLRAAEGVRHEVLLLLTSTRGLCGAYNANVLDLGIQRLGQLRGAGYEVELHVVGRRGVQYLEFRGFEINREHEPLSDISRYDLVAALADSMMSDFLAGRISGLEVAYTQFVSSGQQRPAIVPILPIEDLPGPREPADPDLQTALPFDFLPSPEQILQKLLPVAVRIKLYQCFLDAAAAEQFIRRASMQAATDNANDMIHDLRLRANRQRQRQITMELAEIMSGRSGLGE